WVGGRNPIVRETAAKVYRVFHSVMRVRRSARKKAGVAGLGMIRSLASLYARNAACVVGWIGTSRDFPNFVRRIKSTPVSRSTSDRSRWSASLIRRPVTARRPNRVQMYVLGASWRTVGL